MCSVTFLAVAATAVAATAAAAGSLRANPLDLHRVHWGEVVIPGFVCGAPTAIRLRHKKAVVPSGRFPPYRRVHVSTAWNGVVYADVDGDGKDEAAFQVDCNNGGGTAAGVLGYAAVAFTGARGRLRAVGVITPQQRYRRGSRFPPIVGIVKLRLRKVVSPEAWYGPNDGVCCPSGRARTIWAYDGGKLRVTRTIVDRKPHP